jgi:8-oxo-dGTP diphosphatase
MEDELVRAAGGIVWRAGERGVEVALVHRPAYDDWSFPKGKLMPGEGDQEAALREVEEETGLACRLGPFVGTTRYRDRRGRPKEVRYWLMEPTGGRFSPTREVDRLRWVSVAAAGEVVTQDCDRRLLESIDWKGLLPPREAASGGVSS